ncbi:hypothetical protein FB446DRAFT_762108 [Lentinula raphanica]|nr:hypothetical protein FB446DRAFT_762108 [Lentinula raphanica]
MARIKLERSSILSAPSNCKLKVLLQSTGVTGDGHVTPQLHYADLETYGDANQAEERFNRLTDFYGSGTPCIFKTGPEWPTRKGPEARHFVQEARPIHRHPIQDIQWTSLNPVAYANAGEAKPFCPFVLSIAAAEVVHKILADTGFPTIEVAFVESVATRSAKLLSFDPILNDVPQLWKPFTSNLGGTAALYYRLDQDTKRVVLLTCAHILALSNGSFDAAIEALKKDIEAFSHSVPRLGEPVEGEDSDVTASRKRHTLRVEDALERINKAKALHNELTQHHGTPDQRIIGSVLHSESTQVSVKPNGFSQDWALIEIDDSKIDWPHLKGNKIYIGSYPEDGLLQAYGVVEDAEFRNPQHLDIHNENCLLVVKNGMKTGTTFGRVNGLESFTRCDYGDNNTHHTFIEFAVYRYDHNHPSFSEPGDLGSIVLARDGHIVGLLTGGAGLTTSTEITYITPYWWIEQQIKAKFSQSSFYEVVQ